MSFLQRQGELPDRHEACAAGKQEHVCTLAYSVCSPASGRRAGCRSAFVYHRAGARFADRDRDHRRRLPARRGGEGCDRHGPAHGRDGRARARDAAGPGRGTPGRPLARDQRLADARRPGVRRGRQTLRDDADRRLRGDFSRDRAACRRDRARVGDARRRPRGLRCARPDLGTSHGAAAGGAVALAGRRPDHRRAHRRDRRVRGTGRAVSRLARARAGDAHPDARPVVHGLHGCARRRSCRDRPVSRSRCDDLGAGTRPGVRRDVPRPADPGPHPAGGVPPLVLRLAARDRGVHARTRVGIGPRLARPAHR